MDPAENTWRRPGGASCEGATAHSPVTVAGKRRDKERGSSIVRYTLTYCRTGYHRRGLSSAVRRFAQKKVSGTFRRSELQHLLRPENSRHLFLGKAAVRAAFLKAIVKPPECDKLERSRIAVPGTPRIHQLSVQSSGSAVHRRCLSQVQAIGARACGISRQAHRLQILRP